MGNRKETKTMKALLIGILVLATASCVSNGAAEQSGESQDPQAMAERGRYLVSIAGCHDCHTPFKLGPNGPEPDMTRMLSGHPQDFAMPEAPPTEGPWLWHGAATNTAFAGPWGVSYAFNLTPDEHTGIGIWTEDIFVKTIRSGRHWGVSRPILPPMPWQVYRNMTDEDLRSVYAYLRTIPAVNNKVPDAVIAEPAVTE
jgi:hypothetical protein